MNCLNCSLANNRRHGSVAVTVAIASMALFGIIAIVIDGGVLQDRRRQVQAAADAAALAAAKDLFDTYTNYDWSDNGKDSSGTAKDHALQIAKQNGYDNDGKTSIVTVNIPPKTGSYKDEWGHAEVIIEYRQARYFSTVFGREDVPIRARAVARGRFSAKGPGILVLDPTSKGALTVSGNAIGVVTNAGVHVNSSHAEAAYGEGTTALLTAPAFDINGGVNATGVDQFDGLLNTGSGLLVDPFLHIPEPDPMAQPLQRLQDQTLVDLGGGYQIYYLKPGRYVGGLSFEGKTSVVMAPGIYYMEGDSQGGGFKFTGNSASSLVAEKVMLFNDRGANTVTDPSSPAYPSISISGQATVKWSPPSSGVYQGMSFFQARGQDMEIYIAGQGGFVITGAFYAPDALLDIAGNGVSTIGSQFVTWRLRMRGGGTYNLVWDPGLVPPVREWVLVE